MSSSPHRANRRRIAQAPFAALCVLAACTGPVHAADGEPREAELAAVRLHARKTQLLLERYAPSSVRDAEARRELERMTMRLDRAQTTPPPAPLPGLAEEAYISPLDDSAQPFYRYLPSAWAPPAPGGPHARPLIVFLHGYWSTLDLINWAIFPAGLTNVAEQLGACVAMPFGRSNTDFQGIGEQDVLTVVDVMCARYGTDPKRVVLMGHSMGGMGAWTLGARFAVRFTGLLIVSGRGDYDTWQRLEPGALPPWERALIDAHYLSGQAPRLAGTPILVFHGQLDPVVAVDEAVASFRKLKPHNPEATLTILPEGDHWILEEILAREDCRNWLQKSLATPRLAPPPATGLRPGETTSRLQNAFLDPFLFVQASPQGVPEDANFAQRCAEWLAFAKAPPLHRRESELVAADFTQRNLFLFGEPETSPLLKRVLDSVDVVANADHWILQGRVAPRSGHGLWLAVPSPFAPGRTVVVNCGHPWGEALPSNHRYDMLPDVLVYSPEAGRIGINVALCAARVDSQGTLVWW